MTEAHEVVEDEEKEGKSGKRRVEGRKTGRVGERREERKGVIKIESTQVSEHRWLSKT